MVERVDPEVVESYGVADLGDVTLESFKSVALNGLVEKPTSGSVQPCGTGSLCSALKDAGRVGEYYRRCGW